jgi:hypothetical protein
MGPDLDDVLDEIDDMFGRNILRLSELELRADCPAPSLSLYRLSRRFPIAR